MYEKIIYFNDVCRYNDDVCILCGGAKKAESKQNEGTEIGLPVGLQLYTVRDDLAKDFKGTLQKVKELGYDGVGRGVHVQPSYKAC